MTMTANCECSNDPAHFLLLSCDILSPTIMGQILQDCNLHILFSISICVFASPWREFRYLQGPVLEKTNV